MKKWGAKVILLFFTVSMFGSDPTQVPLPRRRTGVHLLSLATSVRLIDRAEPSSGNTNLCGDGTEIERFANEQTDEQLVSSANPSSLSSPACQRASGASSPPGFLEKPTGSQAQP